MTTQYNRIITITGMMILAGVLAYLGIEDEQIVTILNAVGLPATAYVAIKGVGK